MAITTANTSDPEDDDQQPQPPGAEDASADQADVPEERGLAVPAHGPLAVSGDVVEPGQPAYQDVTPADPRALPAPGGATVDDLFSGTEVRVANGLAQLGARVMYRDRLGTCVQFTWLATGRGRWRVLVRFDGARGRAGFEQPVEPELLWLVPEGASTESGARPSGAYEPPEAAPVELPGMPEHDDLPPSRFDRSAWGVPTDAARKARTRYPVPQDASFDEEDVLDAADLERIADALIEACPLFTSLRTLAIKFYWKRRGGSVEAIAQKVDPFLAKESGADIKVWFAADNLRRMAASELYVERWVFRCLESIDPARPAVNPPDLTVSIPTLLRYGFLSPEEREFLAVLRGLLPLVEGQAVADTTVARPERGEDDGGIVGEGAAGG